MKQSDLEKITGPSGPGSLVGQLLIAMPTMPDPRFAHTVVLMCAHGPDGAMGIVVNRLFGEANFSSLLHQLNITPVPGLPDFPVHFGGPVEPVRGFVLHSDEYRREGTMSITDGISLTATVEVLQDMARGEGPTRVLLALGYAGWGAGQLDNELQANGWLTAPATDDIVFAPETDNKWAHALATIGVSPTMLSADVGHA